MLKQLQLSTVRPASLLPAKGDVAVTAAEGDVALTATQKDIKLAAAAENVSVTAAKAIGLDAETTATVDGKTGVTVTSAKGDVALTATEKDIKLLQQRTFQLLPPKQLALMLKRLQLSTVTPRHYSEAKGDVAARAAEGDVALTATQKDIKLTAAAENVSVTAAKAIGLDAETTATVDGKTGMSPLLQRKAMFFDRDEKTSSWSPAQDRFSYCRQSNWP